MDIQKAKRESKAEVEKLMDTIGDVFAGKCGREMARKYILGLLSPIERKNGWQLAESLGQETPYKIQQFLYRGTWSADELRDRLRRYISERLGEEDGVLIVDETGFLKQGKKSCGVMRQYSGTAGRVENCQVGVFLTYTGRKGHALLDRRLYLPKEWIQNKERCKAAGVPEEVKFQTKPQMALEMLQKALEAQVPFTWVTGDSVYGDFRDIRMWLEEKDKRYVMSVSGKEYVWMGYRQHRVSTVLKDVTEDAWFEESCGQGSKGDRFYRWALLELNHPPKKGWSRKLLIRQSVTKPDELRAYVCYAPLDTPPRELIRIAGTRWTIETCFAESKSQVGLDQYEVRSYAGWYKHITLACIAHALLTTAKTLTVEDGAMIRTDTPVQSSLDTFKKGRGLRV